MAKQGKVKQAKYLGRTWEAHGKTFYVHGIAFENGDFGEYSSISDQQTKFVVGQDAFYEMSGEPGKIKIKPAQDPYDGWSKTGSSSPKPKETPEQKNRGFALSYAKDIVIARLQSKGYEFDEMELLQLADSFNQWLNNEHKEAFKEELPPTKPEDELPF